MPDVHVVPRRDRWTCEIGGNKRSTHATQEEAIKQGRHLAEEQNCELVIHAHDGTFRAEGRPGIDFRGIPG